MKKTAENILRKHTATQHIFDDEITDVKRLKKSILMAMEEYASQFQSPSKEDEETGCKHTEILLSQIKEAEIVLAPYFKSARKREKNKRQFEYWGVRKQCLQDILHERKPVHTEE